MCRPVSAPSGSIASFKVGITEVKFSPTSERLGITKFSPSTECVGITKAKLSSSTECVGITKAKLSSNTECVGITKAKLSTTEEVGGRKTIMPYTTADGVRGRMINNTTQS